MIVIFPITLLESVFELELKSRMPITGVVLAVLEVAVITIVDEPSRLPIALPITSPTLNRPSRLPMVPSPIALNAELVVFNELRADV